MINNHKAEFNKIFNQFSHRHNRYDVFRDFIMMAGFSIQNSVLKCESIEAEYMDIVKRYKKEEVNLFPKLLAELTLGLEAEMGDFLGDIFMSLDLGESRMGQFFTPYHLAKLMSDLCVGDKLSALSGKPFITLSEPACGAGGMIVAVAQSMLEAGFNPSEQLWVEARDLDPVAAMMCYCQLSLLGVPARVITGNTLTLEQSRVFYTPTHYLNNWSYKLNKYWNKDVVEQKEEEIVINTIPKIRSIDTIPAQEVFTKTFVHLESNVEKGENFSLF